MAQRKARKGGSKGRATAARKRPTPVRKPARKASARKAGPSTAAAGKRIAELEAENRRLREEIAALRAERTTPSTAGEAEDRPPALEL